MSKRKAIRHIRLQLRECTWLTDDQLDTIVARCQGQEWDIAPAPCPDHWTQMSNLPGFCFHLRELGTEECQQMQLFLDASLRKVRTKDRRGGPPPDRLVVEKVEHVENELNWSIYVQRREEIAADCWQDPAKMQYIKGVKTRWPFLPGQTDTAATAAKAAAQELFLFHGTSRAGAMCIARDDFCTSFSSESGLFGPGLYFAESATKSDEYADPRDDGLCTMLVTRVCMGLHHTVSADHFDMKEEMEQIEARGLHSLLGDREAARGTFREFIIYDGAAAYAEYIVTYRRAYGDDSAAEAMQSWEAARERAEENWARFEGACERLCTEWANSDSAVDAATASMKANVVAEAPASPDGACWCCQQ